MRYVFIMLDLGIGYHFLMKKPWKKKRQNKLPGLVGNQTWILLKDSQEHLITPTLVSESLDMQAYSEFFVWQTFTQICTCHLCIKWCVFLTFSRNNDTFVG